MRESVYTHLVSRYLKCPDCRYRTFRTNDPELFIRQEGLLVAHRMVKHGWLCGL